MPPVLRIQDVERLTLRVPFTERTRRWNALLVWQWQIVEIIRVTTDDGTVGYGETLPHYTWGKVSDEALERARGANPVELLGENGLGAGLDMALYDVVGKALGVPVHQLLNRPKIRDWCPLAWWNTKMSPADLAGEAQDAVAAGYTTHKFKTRPWFDVYEQVEAIGAVTPEHYRLDLDWNGMLMNVGTATPVMQRLDQYERVSIYESPINQADVEGQRELRRKVAKPIAIHFGSPAFPTAVKESVCDGFVIGGSVATVLRQGELAGAFEKPFWLQMVGTGLVTALSAHLGAVLPFAQWPTITCLNNYIDDLLVEPLTIRGGFLQVPEGPGLGVEVDEEALSQYAMEPPYRLPDERHILTVVWPGGRAVHFANIHDHCWPHFRTHGNDPAQEPGATLEIWDDDGSQEWADLYERLQAGPIREQRS
ncbi:MAG: mandelate racemase/muconate lactonizing enzyme family protein [Gemmatimonadetes bacterium]|jgi:L-alanine-DL-glutamate epimerase-like enolase superfamily enzyme|nr:mandelate racemase/muconate lactonizing enzyme family protein [Gemmatimonadota bacterium]